MTLKIKLKVTEFGGRVMLLGSPYEYGQLKKKDHPNRTPRFRVARQNRYPKIT